MNGVGKKPVVFISYSHSDAKFASALARRLKRERIQYFLDEHSIQWGEPIPERIHQALDQATHILIVMSPGSEQSQWVSYEAGYASGRNLVLVPYLLHPRMKLPEFLASRRYLRNRQDEKRFIQSLRHWHSDVPQPRSSKGPTKKTMVQPSDIEWLHIMCAFDEVGADIYFRHFDDEEIVIEQSMERATDALWDSIFDLVALLGGRERSCIKLGRPVIKSVRRFPKIERNASPFRPGFKEWAVIEVDILLDQEGPGRGLDEGYLDVYFLPYEKGSNTPEPVSNTAATQNRLSELQPGVKNVLERLASVIFQKQSIRLDWEELVWREDCPPWGSEAYWMRGVIALSES